jgi:hypothetical protein
MGANWHMIIPQKVTARTTFFSQKEFLEDYGHLYQPLGGGDEREFVPKNDVSARFHDFYQEFLEHAVRVSGKNHPFMSIDNETNISEIMAEIRGANVFDESCSSSLSGLLYHEFVHANIIYEKWPFTTPVHISGINILTAAEKFGENSIVLLDMKDVIEASRKNYPEIAELICICAY